MNKRLISRMVGFILVLESVSMLIPLFISLFTRGRDTQAFLLSLTISSCFGALFILISRKKDEDPTTGIGNFSIRDAFLSVGLCWILLSLFGALPYYISGVMPNFIDCIFESISGFTTTGATVLCEVERLSKGLLFWRSQTNWMGGMGVLILSLIVISNTGGRAQSLLKAETTGPSPGKIVPRIADSVKILYSIYIGMTVVLTVLLLIAGLKPFDAITVSLSTISTGGDAVNSLSIGAYNSIAVNAIVLIFMILSSINFSVYYALIAKKWTFVKSNTELKFFGIILTLSFIAIWVNIAPVFGVFDGLRLALFQTSSFMSTTGLTTADYTLWPNFSQSILVLLMVVGACGGSTAGGIKVSRLVIMFKAIHREIKKILHPRSVPIVRVDGKALDDAVTLNVLLFFGVYMSVIFGATLILSLDNLDFTTTITAAIQSLGNIGLGLGQIGPSGNYSIFSPLSKLVLSFCMLAGRLEIFPILILISPSSWRKK